MVEGKEIYVLCTALVSGSLAAHFVIECSCSIYTAYSISSVSCLLLAIIASLSTFDFLAGKTQVVCNPVLWTATFVIIGIFCYSTRKLNLCAVVPKEHFSGAYSFITRTIQQIPFKDNESNAIVQALITGNRYALQRRTVMEFRTAGASHFLALSGMHLGIIYVLIDKLLFVIGNSFISRKIRQSIIIVLTLLYTMVCGGSASLVRSWLFILTGGLGLILDRRQSLQQIYCSSLILHIVFQSENVSDIGFQLSYLAMAGITFIWPAMKGWMEGRVWQAASLSICCQICTAPLTYLYFGTFPKYFLITNLAGGPLLSIVMICSITACVVQMIHPGCTLTAEICEIPIKTLRELMSNIAGMDTSPY